MASKEYKYYYEWRSRSVGKTYDFDKSNLEKHYVIIKKQPEKD